MPTRKTFETPEACAAVLAPLFKKNKWKWSDDKGDKQFVPTEDQILAHLKRLRGFLADNVVNVESGRVGVRVQYYLTNHGDR